MRVQVQDDITPVMRGILVDWLVEVAEEYKLSPGATHLTTQFSFFTTATVCNAWHSSGLARRNGRESRTNCRTCFSLYYRFTTTTVQILTPMTRSCRKPVLVDKLRGSVPLCHARASRPSSACGGHVHAHRVQVRRDLCTSSRRFCLHH
jgi:hypothetical protein